MNTVSQSPSPPIFIVGAQRSGTTMLRLMLNAHPNIAVPFESGFIAEVYRELDQFGDLTQDANMACLMERVAEHPFVQRGGLVKDAEKVLASGPKSYGELIDAIYSVFAESRGKSRWGDKDPDYVTEIDVLRTIFPHCLVIHIVRDGRDVAVSRRGVSWGSQNIIRLAQDWKWQVTLGHKMGSLLGSDYLQIFYEQLVQDPTATLQRICDFVSESYSPQMLAYPETAKSEMPIDSLEFHKTSVSAPDPNKIYVWKHRMSETDKTIFEDHAGDTLAYFGYEVEHLPRTFSVKAKTAYYAVFRRW